MNNNENDFTKEDFEKFKKMLEVLSKDNNIFNNTKESIDMRNEILENNYVNPTESDIAVVTPLNDHNQIQRNNDKGEK